MSDAALRSAQRAVALGEPGARELLLLEQLRAGAPDPRWDPRVGAEVEARSGARREVVRLWPGRLVRPLLRVDVGSIVWDEAAPGVQLKSGTRVWLESGTPVLSCRVASSEARDGTWHPATWEVVAVSARHGPAWARVVTATEPEVVAAEDLGAPLPVEAVEWLHCGRGRRTTPARSTLAQWRRWSRRGTVRYLGR